jgi:ribokinase
MQLETPLETVQAAAEIAAKAGVRVILNPAPARPLPDSLLKLVSILTPNETEAELLTGIKVTDDTSAAQAADKLLAKGVQAVILTLGARGAFVATKESKQLVPGFKVKAVDTTAAGDVFNGALAVALSEGRSLLEAARFASAAAAISVTRLGAQPSAPMRKEIEKVLKTGR